MALRLTGNSQVFVNDNGLVLANNGGSIRIRDKSGKEVDKLTYLDEHADYQDSLTRDPDITGTIFIPHSLALGANERRFTPGRKIDHSSF